MLVDYFLKKYSVQYNKPYAELSPDTMRAAAWSYDWPGNIRELENLIKRDRRARHRGADPQGASAHGIAMAAHRRRIASDSRRAPGAAHAAGGRVRATAADRPPRRDRAACAAADAGNYSLKDISRTAAREAERELIFKMLQQTRWNRKETAEILGISYKALLYKIKENGLDKAS